MEENIPHNSNNASTSSYLLGQPETNELPTINLYFDEHENHWELVLPETLFNAFNESVSGGANKLQQVFIICNEKGFEALTCKFAIMSDPTEDYIMRLFSNLKKGAENLSHTITEKAADLKEGAEEWKQERTKKNEEEEEKLVNSLLDEGCTDESKSLGSLNTYLQKDFHRAQELSVNLNAIKELYDNLKMQFHLPAHLIKGIEKRFTTNKANLDQVPVIHGDQKPEEQEILLEDHKKTLDKLVEDRWGSTEPKFGSKLIRKKLAAARSARERIWSNNHPLRVAIARGQACQFELGLYNTLMPLYLKMMELFHQSAIDEKVLRQIAESTSLCTTKLADFSRLFKIPKVQEETYAPIVNYFFYLRRVETYIEFAMLEHLFDIQDKLSKSEHTQRIVNNSSKLEQALFNFQAAEKHVNQHYHGKLDTADVLNTALKKEGLGILAFIYARRPGLQDKAQEQLDEIRQSIKEKQAALQQVNKEISEHRSELIALIEKLIRLDGVLSLADNRKEQLDELGTKLISQSDEPPPTLEALGLALEKAKLTKQRYQATKDALLLWKSAAETNIKEVEALRRQEEVLKEQRLIKFQANIKNTKEAIGQLSKEISQEAATLIIIADNISVIFEKSPYVQEYKTYSEQEKSQLPQSDLEKLGADQPSETIEQQLEAAERQLQQYQDTSESLQTLKSSIVDKIAEAKRQYTTTKQEKLEAINVEIDEIGSKINALVEKLLLNRGVLFSEFPRASLDPDHSLDLEQVTKWSSSVDGKLEEAGLILDQYQRIHMHLTGLETKEERKTLEEQQRLQQRKQHPTSINTKVNITPFGKKLSYKQQVSKKIVLEYDSKKNKKDFAKKPTYRMTDKNGRYLKSTSSFWKGLAWRSGTRDDMVNFVRYITNLNVDNKDLLIYAALLVVKEAIKNEDPGYTSVLWCLAEELTKEAELSPEIKASEYKAKVALSNFWHDQQSGKPKMGKWEIEKDLPKAVPICTG